VNKRVHEEMNVQVKHELESYYIYLSMAAWLHARSLDGMAHWMRVQAHEEMEHAMRFFDHIIERGEKVTLFDLKQIKTEWSSVNEIFEDTLEHEKFITDRIHTIMKVVREENDFPSEPLLDWFVKEQIEEEANANKILDQLKLLKDGTSLYLLDKELAARPWPAVSPINPAAINPAGA